MFDLNKEMRKAALKIQERMIKDAMFGERPPYSLLVSTGMMAASLLPSLPFRPTIQSWTVITSSYIVEKVKCSREKKRGIWQRLWVSLTDLTQWPYSPLEYYEVDVPAIMLDRGNNQIICHPSLEREIKKAVSEGKYGPSKI